MPHNTSPYSSLCGAPEPTAVEPGYKSAAWLAFASFAASRLNLATEQQPQIKWYDPRSPFGDERDGYRAYYEGKTNTIWLRCSLDGDDLMLTLAHEMTHAHEWHSGLTFSEPRADRTAQLLLESWIQHRVGPARCLTPMDELQARVTAFGALNDGERGCLIE